MTCSLLKIPALAAERADQAYICEARKLVAVASPDQKVTIYSFQDWDAEPKQLREYKNHAGAILAAAFAPLKYHAYFLTAGYDKSLFLYNVDDSKQADAIFSYVQENQEIGYFTALTFVPTDKSRLVFAAGTSTGHLVIFDSQANFEARAYPLFSSAIKSLSGNSAGELAVAAVGASPKVIFDFEFENAAELPENGQNLAATIQVRLSCPVTSEDVSRLVTVSEDQTLGIWEVDASLRIPKHIVNVDIGANIIAANWNLGSYSLSVICGKKDGKLGDLKVYRVSRLGSKEGDEWKAYGLEIKND